MNLCNIWSTMGSSFLWVLLQDGEPWTVCKVKKRGGFIDLGSRGIFPGLNERKIMPPEMSEALPFPSSSSLSWLELFDSCAVITSRASTRSSLEWIVNVRINVRMYRGNHGSLVDHHYHAKAFVPVHLSQKLIFLFTTILIRNPL